MELPKNIEAERAVLGAILLDNNALSMALDSLVAEDFSLVPHKHIFSGMVDLRNENQAIDFVTLGELLGRQGKLEQVGGMVYLAQIPDGLPRSSNTDFYARIVKEKSIYRQMIYAAEAVKNMALDPEAQVGKVADQAVEMFSNLMHWDTHYLVMTRKQAAMSLLGQLEKAQDSKILLGIPKVDEFIGGFQNGELIVFTAETGAGKSFLSLQMASYACHAGEHGLYCSGEMRAAHLMARELASTTGVAHSKIRKPSRLSQEDFNLLTQASAFECEHCQILDGELTLPNIRAKARSMGKGKIKFMVVDYDELVEVNGVDDEWEAQRVLVRALKALGLELDIPVFLVSQLRKALDKQERSHPTLQRLYGSGAKIKHASIVIYIDRPFVVDVAGDETEAKIYILKNRDGRLGRTDAKFNIHTFRFEQWDKPAEEPMRSRKPKQEEDDDDV